jgi:hypothetical protein
MRRPLTVALCMTALATTLGGATPGCAPPEQSESTLPVREIATYAEHVHPLLEASCATLDCHGQNGRPLRLYSETGLRLRDDLRGQPQDPTMPVTGEELLANVLSIAAVDGDVDVTSANVDSTMMLRKPLSSAGSGVHHEGRQLWSSRSDVAYVCVRSWLLGTVDADTCAEAKARDALPPP